MHRLLVFSVLILTSGCSLFSPQELAQPVASQADEPTSEASIRSPLCERFFSNGETSRKFYDDGEISITAFTSSGYEFQIELVDKPRHRRTLFTCDQGVELNKMFIMEEQPELTLFELTIDRSLPDDAEQEKHGKTSLTTTNNAVVEYQHDEYVCGKDHPRSAKALKLFEDILTDPELGGAPRKAPKRELASTNKQGERNGNADVAPEARASTKHG